MKSEKLKFSLMMKDCSCSRHMFQHSHAVSFLAHSWGRFLHPLWILVLRMMIEYPSVWLGLSPGGGGTEISKQACLSLMLAVYCRRQLLTQQFHKSVHNYRVWSNGRKLQNSVRENKEKTNLDSLTEEVTQIYNVYSRSVEKRLKRLNLSPRY